MSVKAVQQAIELIDKEGGGILADLDPRLPSSVRKKLSRLLFHHRILSSWLGWELVVLRGSSVLVCVTLMAPQLREYRM